LTGAGEPFLHPRLFDMIATAKQARLHVVLVTNGTLLDRDRIEGVVHSGLDVLRVSSWGIGGGEEAGGNRGGEWGLEPETLSKTLKNLSRVKGSRRKRKPIVVLHRPLHRLNFDTAEAACDLALGTGCEGVTFSPLKPIGGRLSALALQPEEERRVRSGLRRIRSRLRSKGLRGNVDEVLLRYRIGEEVWRKLPCYVPWYHTRITTDGAVIPCEGCDLPLGNVRDQPLREIWNHLEYRRFRRKARTREGLRSLGDRCDCRFCCHVFVNSKIHGVMRWMDPLGLMKNRRTVEP
jgi:radical SAM protein with 4Fe4S-binding SPASM domain